MVRQVTCFRAEDGSVHDTEREALLADVRHILNVEAKRQTANESRFTAIEFGEAGVTVIVACLPALLPILAKLNDPRNTAPRPRPEAPGSPLPDGVRELIPTFIDEAVVGAPIPFSPDVAWDDLRLGQRVEFEFQRPAEEAQDEGDNEIVLATGIIDLLDGPIDDIGGWAHVSHDGDREDHCSVLMPGSIKRVLKQPEQLLPLEDAKAQLAEMEAEPPAMDTSEGRAAYARRVMLMARVAELEKENGDDVTA